MSAVRGSQERQLLPHPTVRLALVAIVVVPLLFFAVAAYSYHEVAASFQRVLDDGLAGGAVREEFQAYLDRETGLRGYAATDDRRFLEPYTKAQATIPAREQEALSRMLALGLSDALAANLRVIRLQNEWNRTVDDQLLATPTGPRALYWQLRGKQLMDQTRAAVDETRQMITRDRDKTTTQTKARLLALVGGALFLGLCLTSLAVWAEYKRTIETARFAAQMEERAKELERSNAALADFAYAASHDLQEPLRMVSSYTQLLSRRYKGKLDKDADEFIEFAVDGAKRMEAMIKDLLAYSRAGSQAQVLEPTDSGKAVEEALGNLKIAIEESGAIVEHGGLPTVLSNPSLLSLVFQNLIGNAIKYRGDAAPRIRVSAKRDGADCVFSVEDNGIGIEPRHLDRVFRMFQRLHTRKEYAGTGIGLAIVKRVVELQGGTIWVESVLGKGSTFFFTLLHAEGQLSFNGSGGGTKDDRDLARRG
jgi:signal transduction histidine kinase